MRLEDALGCIVALLILFLLCKDMGAGAASNLRNIGTTLSSIQKEMTRLNKAIESLEDTIKITRTGERENWRLNSRLEWEKNDGKSNTV